MSVSHDNRLNVLGPAELDDVGPQDADGGDSDSDSDSPLILITGAAGNLGRKLVDAWRGHRELILIDRDPGGDPEIIAADLSRFSEDWAQYFDEADVVIHLAATPNEFSGWEDLAQPNLDALCNVLLAASSSGVGRVLFASSNHVMGGYRDQPDLRAITEDMPPLPGNPYGACKLMGERLGVSLASAMGAEFIGLRLGWVQRGDNAPGTLPDDWARKLWLSNGDLVRLFNAAITVELPAPALIVNGLSANQGTLWSLEKARRFLKYEPIDDAFRSATKG